MEVRENMIVRRRLTIGGAALTFAAALVLSGCSASDDTPAAEGFDPDAKVTLVLGERPPASQPDALALWEKSVENFEKMYPNITVEPSDSRYDVSTFSAQLLGGTLPTTLAVPFTDVQGLIERGQAADITQFVEDDPVLNAMNPSVTQVAERDGKTYGLVRQAYALTLNYNRALYEQAGLDPDMPPTTWDEVRENARIIAETTGATGFVVPTVENTGGWISTALSYAFGSAMEEIDGDDVTVTVDSPGYNDALEWLQSVRWEDNAAGENFLMSMNDVSDAYAAGRIGQVITGSTPFKDYVVNRGMPIEDIGIGPMPQAEDGLGYLTGGSVQWFRPDATANEIHAGLLWTKFYYLNRYADEDAAVEWAETQVASGFPVGQTEIPLFDAETYDRYLEWIGPYIDVDRSLYEDFLSSIQDTPLIPEPAVKAQELYAALDPVVQAVLTRQDADIADLLSTAQTQVQAIIDAP